MLTITAIPAFTDNYLWLIEGPTQTWVVDPGDASVIKEALAQKNKTLDGILITHHHADHIGGVADLTTSDTRVIGPALNQFSKVNEPVSEGDQIDIDGFIFKVIDLPGHTLNHIGYFCEQHAPNVLFSGDTLFAGGCGRIFEGTPAQMNHSLQKLAKLSDTTSIYCAHEYTQANLSFAQHLEPDNQDIKERLLDCKRMRKQGIKTVPSLLALEKKTNPFLRTNKASLFKLTAKELNITDPSSDDIFATIRTLKDHY